MRAMGKGEAVQDRKLFVGGLQPETTVETLDKYFSKWGQIVDLVVMKDNESGRSRGFGFVTYAEAEQAEQAVAEGPHEIDGKQIDTKRAISKESVSENIGATNKVFVGGLKREITNEQIEDYFQQFGPIKEALIMTEKETGESRGFAFVTFENEDSVEKVMDSKPHNIGEAQIDVQKAVSKEDMRRKNPKKVSGYSGGPGGGGGGSRGHNSSYYGGRYRGGQANYGDYGYYDGWGGGGGGGGGYDGYGSSQGGYYGYQEPYYPGNYGEYSYQSYHGGPMRGHYDNNRPSHSKNSRQPYGRNNGAGGRF